MPTTEPGERTRSDIEADIEQTREELANTVEQLTERLDVRRAAKAQAPRLAVAGGVLLGLVVTVALIRRRR